MTLRQLENLVKKETSIVLSAKEKEAIWESFKAKLNIEENPDSMDDRMVSVPALINARKQSRLRKIEQLIS
jgi:hypothetical protein